MNKRIIHHIVLCNESEKEQETVLKIIAGTLHKNNECVNDAIEVTPCQMNWVEGMPLTIFNVSDLVTGKHVGTFQFLYNDDENPILTVEDIVEYNEMAQTILIDNYEKPDIGIKDSNLLVSSVNGLNQGFSSGEFLYPSILDKAAHLWFSLARNHCFNNGNKRTSIMALFVFLWTNGYYLNYNETDIIDKMDEVLYKELYCFTKDIAAGKVSKEEIIDHLYDHCYINFEDHDVLLGFFNRKEKQDG